MQSACAHKEILHLQRRTQISVVAVVDGRPQGVGRQPVSQNEAQRNRRGMNTFEVSQTTASNTEWDTESKQLLACVQ